MLVNIFTVNYQLRAHNKAGRHKFIKPSLNEENITTTNVQMVPQGSKKSVARDMHLST